MKAGIHPETHLITSRCACGSTFKTLSTHEDLSATICSACHPFFTGEKRHVDTAGRIEKFNRRFGAAQNQPAQKKTKGK
jgi:large subunit ribosomal protein L31